MKMSYEKMTMIYEKMTMNYVKKVKKKQKIHTSPLKHVNVFEIC